jgi:hypothetical protein
VHQWAVQLQHDIPIVRDNFIDKNWLETHRADRAIENRDHLHQASGDDQ